MYEEYPFTEIVEAAAAVVDPGVWKNVPDKLFSYELCDV